MEPRIARRASIEYMCVYCGRKEIRGWKASVRGVAENCRTAGCKTALTAGKQTGKIERHLLHGKVVFFCKSLNPAKTMPKSKVFAEMGKNFDIL